MSIDRYRETEYAAAVEHGIFLNHAGSAPMAASVGKAITEAITVTSRDPERYFMQHVVPAVVSARNRLASFMGVPPEHVALMRNTSQGLAVVADGLALDPGDNVLVASCEYPSVVYPWYAQAWRGVETRVIDVGREGRLPVEAFAARTDGRTRVIALSWVQFATGYRADLAAFADFAKGHNLLIVLDAIQALGVLPLQAEALGIDVVVTGTQKWLLAPHGTGAVYISPATLARMHLVNMGACSVVDIPKFDSMNFDVKPNAQRYEEGSPNGLGLIGLDAALGILEAVGIDNVAERVLSLTRHAMDAVTRRGYRVASPLEDKDRAGIVLFDHPDHASEDLLKILKLARVAASVRNGCVRWSPHFYNSFDEIDAAVAALPV
jgi:cysteine desulfurase / selenocysteine lyase